MKNFYSLILLIGTLSFLIPNELNAQCNVTNTGSVSSLSNCNQSSVDLGAGESRTLSVPTPAYYTFSFTNNSQSSGFCVTINSITTHYPTGPVNIYLTGNATIGMYRNSAAWTWTSAVLRYQKTRPTIKSATINGVTNPASICVGGSIDLFSSWNDATGYSWSGPNSYSSTSINPAAFATTTTNQGGTYSVSAQNAGCWSTTTTRSITVIPDPSLPTVNVKSPNVSSVCEGQTLSATFNAGTGGLSCTDSYQYSTDGGFSWSPYTPGSNISTTGLGSTTVYIQGRRVCSTANCDGSAENFTTLTSWSIVSNPTISITSQGSSICVTPLTSTNITASTSGGTGTCTYQWQTSTSSASGPWTNVGTNSNTFNTGAISQNLWVRCQRSCNGSSCNTAISGVTLVSPTPETPTVANTNVSGCGTASVFAAEGAYGDQARFYLNSISPGNLLGSGTSYTFSAMGTFNVVVTSYATTSGCESSGVSVTVQVNPSFAVGSNLSDYNGEDISCVGASDGFIEVVTSGAQVPIDYLWSTGDQIINSSSISNMLTGLSAGAYDVTITDDNNCSSVYTATLQDPDPINVSLTSPLTNGYEIDCNGASTGEINTSVSGGTGAYQYFWLPYGTGANPTGLAAGEYTVYVLDANSCVSTTTIELYEPNVPAFNYSVGYVCFGSIYNNAILNFSPYGGVGGPYDYSIDGGTSYQINDPTFSGITDGQSLQLRVRDANGCVSSIVNTTVTYPAPGVSLGDCDFIYVSNSGDPTGTIGSQNCPVTLAQAFNIYNSDNSRDHILMLGGNYNYNEKIEIPGNVTIDGSYVDVGGEWVKSTSNPSIVNINPPFENNGSVGYYIGIQPLPGANNFKIKDITFNVLPSGATGTYNKRGISIYGIYLSGQTGYTISRCVINTGSGSKGEAGVYNGSYGGGSTGGAGGTNPCLGTAMGCSKPGCSGGVGYAGSGAGGSGGLGGSGCTSQGCNIFGCDAGGCTGGPGGNGASGGTGSTPGGSPNATPGLSQFYSPVSGAQGNPGGGGGGGGSGGNGAGGTTCLCSNNSGYARGGDGGTGGTGGAGGAGGFGGGGSFGIYVWGGSGTIIDTDLNPSAGGAGGAGALGRPGYSGNYGAAGTSQSGCTPGRGGTGGRGGAGGRGGTGQLGSTGLSRQLVTLNSASVTRTGSTVPSNGQLTANVSKGCTNSEIVLTKTSSNTWAGNPPFVNDLTSSTSSYNSSDNTIKVFYTTTGEKDLTIGSIGFNDFITIRETRTLPTIDPISNICPNDNITLGTSYTASDYKWNIVDLNNPSSSLYTNSSQSPGLITFGVLPFSSWTSGHTYQVSLQVYDECCGWSIPVHITFDVVPVPAQPSIISTNDNIVCKGQTGVSYSVISEPLVTYTWSVSGGVIASGQGSNSITVNWNNTSSGNVQVTPSSICGSGTPRSLPITKNDNPTISVAPSSVDFCNGQSTLLQASSSSGTGGNGFLSYIWSNSSTNSNITVSTSGTYNVTVTEGISECTSSATSIVVVNPNNQTTTSWTGAVSTDWHDYDNWTNCLPGNNSNVVIPVSAPNQPVIYANGINMSNGLGECKTIEIQTGASLTIKTNATLEVSKP